MDLKPLRTEPDYLDALRVASAAFNDPPPAGTAQADRLEVLTMLIEAYEEQHYRIAPPDPIEAILFHMDQAGLSPADLQPMIGRLNRVYEILNRKRVLTLPMIRRLHAGLGIPAESLIGGGAGERHRSEPVRA